MQMSVASVDHGTHDPKPFTLSLAALSRLYTAVPRAPRPSEPGPVRRRIAAARTKAQPGRRPAGRPPPRADVGIHALTSLLELDPPELSVVFVHTPVRRYMIGGANPVRVDQTVNEELKRDASLGLEQTLGWFPGTANSVTADLSAANGGGDATGEPQGRDEPAGGSASDGGRPAPQPQKAPRP